MTPLRALRNFAIIAVLAFGLALIPSGGNVAQALLTLFTIVMFGAIAALVVRGWNMTGLQRDAMTDRQRGLIYGSLGAIALMIAGTDELWDTGLGTVVWLGVLATSVWLIVQHLARGPKHLNDLVRLIGRYFVRELAHSARHTCARGA